MSSVILSNKTLETLLREALCEMGIIEITPQIDFPVDLAHGDYTTNVAMVLARKLKKNPVEIAEVIVSKLKVHSSKFEVGKQYQNILKESQKGSENFRAENALQDIDRVEVVKPGFINFYLSTAALGRQLEKVLEEKEAYGSNKSSQSAVRSSQNDKKKLLPTTHSPLQTKRIMVEFAHPNTHKAFHIGHLRNISIGESIVRLLEATGYQVIRANYQGDVGMHIAKALFALSQISNFKFQISNSQGLNLGEKITLLGQAYAAGSKAFEEDKAAQETIKEINYLIYAAVQRYNKERGIPSSSTDYMKFVSGRGVEVDQIYELWKETRQWSLDYFDLIYKRVGTRYDRLYFESECLSGVDIAKDAVKKGILKESEGAIIFDGKPFGLDTRVFVNSLGLPTYEGKELALAKTQFTEFGHLDQLIHVLGPEQVSFTKVTFKAEELLGIQKDQQLHLVYGWVKLKHGKMSSRSGNVVLGEWLLDQAEKYVNDILSKSKSNGKKVNHITGAKHFKDNVILGTNEERTPESETDTDSRIKFGTGSGQARMTTIQYKDIAQKVAVAAVKYSFLRVSTLNEIAFDLEESVNFNGDSGPYLQYTYARARSVLRKSEIRSTKSEEISNIKYQISNYGFNLEEKLVLRLINRFTEIVTEAAAAYSPSIVCEYLYDLASAYNTFYNKHSILGSDNAGQRDFRLGLTAATAQVLKNGLYLLGIETLEQM